MDSLASMVDLMASASSSTRMETAMKVIGSMGVNMEKAFTPKIMLECSIPGGLTISLLNIRCSMIKVIRKASLRNSYHYLQILRVSTQGTGAKVHPMVMVSNVLKMAITTRAYSSKDGAKA